jgi:hypothetical protein
LEFDESEEAEADSESFEFNVDLEDEDEAGEAVGGGGISDDLDFDLDGQDMESEAEAAPEAAMEAEPSEDFTDPFDMGIPTDDLGGASEEVDEEPAPSRKAKKKKSAGRRVGAPVLALLLLAILGGGGYYAYTAGLIPESLQKQVAAYLPSWIAGSQPVGEVVPVDAAIRSRYVRNAETGLLFVVTGQVQNKFSAKRDHIRVDGKLLDGAGEIVGRSRVFAGNTLSDEELGSLDSNAVARRLGNRRGENDINVGVEPGIRLPFMMVFSDLPENLAEFTVEVAGSDPHAE